MNSGGADSDSEGSDGEAPCEDKEGNEVRMGPCRNGAVSHF